MNPTAYYNENDKFAAAWLRELITRNLIAPGEVDERDIRDVLPSDLLGFTQCHFFAGIGVWSHALRAAGWPDSRPVWTGSCPCQPFSSAGKGGGTTDERHLWPAFFHLISESLPRVIFGEQVEAAVRHGWLDLVQDDLEGIGYAFGAVGFPAAGYGAPHIRQRLYFVADSMRPRDRSRRCSTARDLADTINGHLSQEGRRPLGRVGQSGTGEERRTAHAVNGFWRASDWLLCRDRKFRPIEPGTFPLAHGAANRVGRLRGYGNAIVAPQAEAFIRAFMQSEGSH